ncbi:MAG TPA: hypothetical protein VIO60_09465, partial [Rectinemataceae bacterium]
KDVPGVAKADPRLVPAAPYLEFLDYDSMFRLARHGARVLHDKSAVLAKAKAVRMRVRSTFGSGTGTLIGPASEGAAPPDFIGLSTSAGPGGRSKLTAVFALGRAGAYRRRAAEFAARAGLEPMESGDEDAISFGCPGSSLNEVAPALFAIFEG